MQPLSFQRGIVAAARVVTCDERRPGDLGVIEDGAVLIEQGRIVAVDRRELIEQSGAPLVVCSKGVMTPGFVDAHTHSAWVGSRHEEYEIRLAGGDYEAIAKAGGGIRSSMRAIRAASQQEVAQNLRGRLSRMSKQGITTVEVKSGYGLDEENERKQLLAIQEVAASPLLPRVIPTYLALHAIPPEFDHDRAAFLRAVPSWLRAIASDGLAHYVDAYVDRSAFSVEEAEPVLQLARELGLGVRVHAGQFAEVGACLMAARLGASSADHLEQTSQESIAALAAANVAAVLLPIASFTLRQAPPSIVNFRAAGLSLVIASDANPGTAPTESLSLAIALAARTYGLSPSECLLGVTRHAARSLGLAEETGVLRSRLWADLVIWDLPHENALVQPWCPPPIDAVFLRGSRVL